MSVVAKNDNGALHTPRQHVFGRLPSRYVSRILPKYRCDELLMKRACRDGNDPNHNPPKPKYTMLSVCFAVDVRELKALEGSETYQKEAKLAATALSAKTK